MKSVGMFVLVVKSVELVLMELSRRSVRLLENLHVSVAGQSAFTEQRLLVVVEQYLICEK